jgi:predicted NAD/FAD-dependent oxidoreductase
LFGTVPAHGEVCAPGKSGMSAAARRKRLAIVGAGPSGLAAAWRLRDVPEIDVTVFEKSNGVFGRAATRTRHGVRLDPGANYFRTDLPEIASMVHSQLQSDDLIEIAGAIDVFDRFGMIAAGDASLNAQEKWTYGHGISSLGTLLAEAAGCNIVFDTRVGRIKRDSRSRMWEVFDEELASRGVFDVMLLALPAPQAIALLPDDAAVAISALTPASYHAQWSFTFGFDSDVYRWPGQSYALINADRQHPIAWTSRENAKPGRIPDQTLAIMVQMQPAWSVERFDRDAGQLAPEVASLLAELLGWHKVMFRWFDAKRWKYSLPSGRADLKQLRLVEADGLYVAGDAVVGKGRVALALQSGLDAAARIVDSGL